MSTNVKARLLSCAERLKNIRLPFRIYIRNGAYLSRLAAYSLAGLFLAAWVSLLFNGLLLNRSITAKEELAGLLFGRSPGAAAQQMGTVQDLPRLPEAFGVSRSDNGGSAGVVATPLSSMELVGTLPGIAAWIRVGGDTQLILRGREIKGYELTLVDTGKVMLSLDGDNQPLYLLFSSETQLTASRSVEVDDGGKQEPPAPVQIQQAEPNKGEGRVSRELIQNLMSNPYGEISKIRMVPDPSGKGMKFLRIAPDSLFSQLGMQEGDTLRGFNGVAIENMMDLSNAVRSITGGDRMDIRVDRNSEDVQLRYAVQ